MSIRTVISERLVEQLTYPEMLRRTTDFRQVGPEERVKVQLSIKGVRAYWVSTGGGLDSSVVRTEHWEPVGEEVSFHVSEPSNLIESDVAIANAPFGNVGRELERLADLLGPAAAHGVDVAVVDMVLRILRSATRSGGGFSGRTLPGEAVGEITAQGHDPVMIGWRAGPCWDVTRVTLDDFIDRSRFDDMDHQRFPVNEVFIYPPQAFSAIQWGDLVTKEWDDYGSWRWNVMGKATMGFVCNGPVWSNVSGRV